jgi:hypothetical protein
MRADRECFLPFALSSATARQQSDELCRHGRRDVSRRQWVDRIPALSAQPRGARRLPSIRPTSVATPPRRARAQARPDDRPGEDGVMPSLRAGESLDCLDHATTASNVRPCERSLRRTLGDMHDRAGHACSEAAQGAPAAARRRRLLTPVLYRQDSVRCRPLFVARPEASPMPAVDSSSTRGSDVPFQRGADRRGSGRSATRAPRRCAVRQLGWLTNVGAHWVSWPGAYSAELSTCPQTVLASAFAATTCTDAE